MNFNQVSLPVRDISTAVEFYLKPGFTRIVLNRRYARSIEKSVELESGGPDDCCDI